MANTESLTLKWGTLKGWNLKSEASMAALRKFHEDPVSLSAMSQINTDKQQEAIIELIDVIDADQIYLDWDGEMVSKEDAKQYVRDYGEHR